MSISAEQILWIIGACATGSTVIFHIGMSIGAMRQRLTQVEKDVDRHEEALQTILEEGTCRTHQ